MINKLKIEGLDCPNCARTLENEINKLNNVQNAHIDFVKSLLNFESDNFDDSLDVIIKLTKKLEPQATISKINKNITFPKTNIK